MKKLFLVGSPRSGTTLLQTILTAQLQLFTVKETHFFRNLHRWRPIRWLDRLSLDQRRVDAAFRFLTSNNELAGGYHWGTVRSLSDACRLLDHILSSEARHRSCAGWLEKTPEHMFFVDEIRRTVPEARFVHILRNGPDVVASLYDAKVKYPEHWGWLGTVDNMVRLYNRYVNVSRSNLGRSDTFLIRYDDLIETNGDMLRKLETFLGVDRGSMSFERVASYRSDIVRPEELWKVRDEKRLVDTRGKKFELLFKSDERQRILQRLVPAEDIVSG